MMNEEYRTPPNQSVAFLPFIIHHSPFRAREWALLIMLVSTFAVGTSFLSWTNARAPDLAPRFHWPDETSNAYFATRISRGESLAVSEPRNVEAGNLIHPRTVNVRADGSLVPGSYLGLPLWYGLIGRAVGERAMLFFTPLLAALGLLAFASIVRRLMGSSAALIATVLLVLHPSVWLFTATTFLPNVPFVALLLMGVAMLVRADSQQPTAASTHPPAPPLPEGAWKTKTDFSPSRREGEREGVGRWRMLVRGLLGGLLIGLALTIRTHELVWVLAAAGAIVWQQKKKPGFFFWKNIGALVFGIAVPFIPILFLNAQLYGSPFTTGYALLQDGGAAPTEFAASFLPGWLMALIAPFGWHPIEAFARFWTYMVVPYPWFIALAIVGFVAGILSQFRTKLRKIGDRFLVVVTGTIVLVIWLTLFYGSWEIADPLVRETNVLTISYVRYWLPITVILAPWAVVGFMGILGRIPLLMRKPVAALAILGIALTSFTQVVTDPNEGLLRQRQSLAEHRTRARAVIAATEPDAVIVSHRMDKVFFPERAVVHAPIEIVSPSLVEGEREGVVRTLRALVDHAPVYWYTPGEVTVSELSLTSVGEMPFGERLYRVE